MKRLIWLPLAFFLYASALMSAGCMYPPMPIPVPPGPTPTPPAPAVCEGLDRADFAEIQVGADAAVLDALPAPDTETTVGSRTLRSWTLAEMRPDGGCSRWEVHTEGGKVVASFAW